MAKAEKRLVVGVDGVKGGAWVAVALRGRRFAEAAVLPKLADVIDRWPEAVAIGVDIPIGLPPPFPRRADGGARELLKPAIARVFMTHVREVYEASTHAEATTVALAVDGEGVSQQAWRLRDRILEAATLRDPRAFEVHPEASFARMHGGPLASKRSWQGVVQRIELLEREGIQLPSAHDAGHVAPADVLDAAAAAWTARRRARGQATPIPADPAEGEPVIWV